MMVSINKLQPCDMIINVPWSELENLLIKIQNYIPNANYTYFSNEFLTNCMCITGKRTQFRENIIVNYNDLKI